MNNSDARLAGYNPLEAPEAAPMVRRNIARLVANEVVDMPKELKEASNIPLDKYVEFWTLRYHTLDAQLESGDPLVVNFGTRLFNDKGQPLSQGQRPWVCAMAFKGLGFVIYPYDPAYDANKVLNHVFEIEEHKFPTGRAAPVPIRYVGGPNYVYTDEVRIVRPKNQAQNEAVGHGVGQTTTREVTEDPNLARAIVSALAGTPVQENTKILNILREQQLTEAVHVDGLAIVSLAATGKLADKLASLGLIQVEGGLIVPAAARVA